MNQQDILYNEINSAFTHRRFQLSDGLTKDQMGRSKDLFKAMAYELIDRAGADGRIRAQEILDVWERNLGPDKKAPADGWLDHCYLYLRNQMFSHLPGPADESEYRSERASLLQLFRGVYDYERKALPFDPTKDMPLLSEKDVTENGFTPEYLKFRKLVRRMYLYEFMRIGIDITPYNTLGHIGGVHYVALYMAEQLYRVGVPVDLALVSAASASHDIGKYGCRPSEERRIPYLHYYYTDYFLNQFDLTTIAHIAANHSTWDLELENLSVESLLLIYADFRVKSTRDEEGEHIHFYTLAEAFDVILSKLDNVDEAKKHRYEKVYAKLKDFEDYMVEHGVDTTVPHDLPATFILSREDTPTPATREMALLQGNEITNQVKYSAIDHNIRLMSRFNSMEQFSNIIESARSESRWKNLRTYLNILGEYSTYMTEEQKSITLHFLYETLAHHESDIREQAATLMGRMIAKYREEYKKELPKDIPAPDITTTNLFMYEQYLDKLFYPDHKYTDQHKRWISSCTDFFVKAVVGNCREYCRHRYFEVLEKYYSADDIDEEGVIVRMSIAHILNPEICPDSFSRTIRFFTKDCLGTYSLSVDLITLDVLDHFFPEEYRDQTGLRRRQLLGLESDIPTPTELSTMFLDDLKTRTPWVRKVANIRYMLRLASDPSGEASMLHIATHLANLIKVSETVTVRRIAGDTLLEILPKMASDQINELMIELFNGLEIEDAQFSRFIPDILGVVILYLPPQELNEVVNELENMLNIGSVQSASAALRTLSVALENYGIYDYGETKEVRIARAARMLGLLTKGFAHYNDAISQEAFHTVGEQLYNSKILTMKDKKNIGVRSFKRMLTILPEESEKSDLEFYNNAAVLNKIYRFISEYQTEIGELKYRLSEKFAFFPGTFDPFSRGHKAIATTIRDMGFEVYLAVDEFSWSKKTLPRLLRENILKMSIADEDGLFIFPNNISINIANPLDLRMLKSLFPGQLPYIAVGSDVVLNASSYRKEPTEDSIHGFNHIVFARSAKKIDDEIGDVYPITGEVVNLKLNKYYEDISSTKIRDNIDLGRDISNLIDPIAQNYIYDRNFYSREPAYKHVLQAAELAISDYEYANHQNIPSIRNDIVSRGYDFDALYDYLSNEKVRVVTIESGSKTRKITAFAAAKRTESHDLLAEFGSTEIASRIRKIARGGIAVIGAIYASPSRSITNLPQILLTEFLTSLVAKDYTYAVYHPVDPAGMSPIIVETLIRQGFVNISEDPNTPVYGVDLTDPIVMFRDVETVIKAPLNKNARVQKALDDAHNRLLQTFNELFPGKLILSFNTSAVYSKIVDLVARDNGVSTIPDPERRRGPYLSVPFGKALSDVIVPNTVTKALRTEKYFRNDLSGFQVRESHDYATLTNQAKTLKSFDRPVILIDDLLHKGQRMNNIDPILRDQGVDVHKIIVGLLTGNARDSMTIRNREVEGAYFLPTISMWLNERDCYPFIGGDSIDSPDENDRGSINFLLPYTTFSFVGGQDMENIYKYSMTCLENALDILRVLEQEYQATLGKKLTLKRLGAVITSPRRPLLGAGLEYDEHMSPSEYVANDIRRAKKLHLFREAAK